MTERKKAGKVKTFFVFAAVSLIYFVSILFLTSELYDADMVFIIAAVVLSALEFLIGKLTRVNSLVLALSLPAATLFGGLVFSLLYPMEIELLFKDMLLCCGIRALFLIIDFISLKKYKFIPLALILSAVFLISVPFTENLHERYLEGITGNPDITGSWGAINQEVKRESGWKEIVTNTEFRLGEPKEKITEYDEGEYDENEYNCSMGTYPVIDGSTVCVPMAVEFARQHLDMDDYCANNMTAFSTTHYAYENLIMNDSYYYSKLYWLPMGDKILNISAGSADIILATEPSDEELEMAQSYGVALVKEPVCYDAFVFITHKDNPVESLTTEQIKDIYSGKIKNWKEVGGNDEKIVAYQREKNSGSQTAMENLVMGGTDMIDPIEIKTIVGMGELIDVVAEYENETASIGYTYRYYIDTLYKNENIKTIAVDGIAPTDDNIRSRAYPFTTNYYGVIRQGDEEKTGGKFLSWILSDEGQKCVAQAGYITVK